MKNRTKPVLTLLCILICASLISGCGEAEADMPVTQDEVDAFLSDDDMTTDDESGADAVSFADAVSEETEDTGEAAGTQGLAIYGGLTEEEFDALPLEKQDAIRDEARKKVTPAYEDAILPEYRELYDYNNAVIGYIYIDGTVIDAPVLQTLADYEYYLNHDIDGRETGPGCIILDADSEIGIGTKKDGYLTDYEPSSIQLVHGHNMRSGSMFGSLLKYSEMSYADAHSVIDYDSLYEHRSYEVICAFYSEIYPEDSPEFKYTTWNQLDSEEEFDVWWENISDMALYIRDVAKGPSYGDEFIVLSTCSYHTENGRFAVVGIRTE